MVFLCHLIGVLVLLSTDTMSQVYVDDALLKKVSWNEAVTSCRQLNKTLPMKVDQMILKMLKESALDSIWLGIEHLETNFSWSDDAQADGVKTKPLRAYNRKLKCGVVRVSSGIVYANSCSTKVAGFICNKKCSICSEEACFTQNGRCYMTFCRQKMVDWYSAAEYCENHFSGLATEITGNGTKGKGNCSEFWIGLTKERWKAGDSYVIHHGWLAGEEDRSHHCAFVSGRGKTNRKLSDCTSVRNAICLPRSIQTLDVVLEETSVINVSIFLGFGEESTVYNLSITQQIQARWLIGAASLCIPLALALSISIGVHLYRHCKRKGVNLLPVVRRRNNSIPCPRQALHSSVTFYGSSFVTSTSNSLKSQESVCSMCGQSNEDNNLHYENMLMTEVTRCGACGRLVKPQRPVKPRPALPKRVPESSVMAIHKYSPVASLKWQDDYENMARGLKTIPVKELRVANLLLATEPTSSTQPRGLGSRRPKSIL